jgi:hypothetical protein
MHCKIRGCFEAIKCFKVCRGLDKLSAKAGVLERYDDVSACGRG